MSKELCKLSKGKFLEENFDEYVEMVNAPKYICKKCGRASNDESRLCKPKKIKG